MKSIVLAALLAFAVQAHAEAPEHFQLGTCYQTGMGWGLLMDVAGHHWRNAPAWKRAAFKVVSGFVAGSVPALYFYSQNNEWRTENFQGALLGAAASVTIKF